MSRVHEAMERASRQQETVLVTRTADAESERSYWQEPAVVPAGEGEHLDVRRMFQVLLERRWQILLVALLVIVPAVIATLLQERLYESATLIEVATEPVQVLPYRDVAAPSTAAAFDPAREMAREEEMLKGSIVTSRVRERLKTHPEAAAMTREIGRLSRQVSVTPVPNSRMIRVGYLAWRADVAATIANVWADEFIKATFDARQETRLKARQLLQRELATLERQVQSSEQALVRYAQAHGLDPAEAGLAGNDLAHMKLSTVAASVTAAETALIEARSRLEMLESATPDSFPEKLTTPTISGRQMTLLQLEHDLTGLTSTFGPNWPAVVQKRNEIAVVREQLDREKNAAIVSAREQALLEYRAADTNRRMLTTVKAGQEKVVAGLQDASIEYNNIRREVQTNQKLYEGLLERLKQTDVAPGMEFENVRVIEPAQVRNVVAQPQIFWNVLLAVTLGLGLGVSVAFGREFWNDALSNPEELERVTSFPVLGTIPRLSAPSDTRSLPRRILDAGPSSPGPTEEASGPASEPAMSQALLRRFQWAPDVSEAVRSICASLLLSRSERAPRTLLITSALPGEGKTTLAAQLGRAFADTGCRTLLVECDLRRPKFAKVLGLGSEGGLSLFLAGHIERPTLHEVIADRLVVVAAGPAAPNPMALLHSERMRTFLAEMTRTFQFVILDGPPVLPIADARMLGALSEGVVLVVRADATSRKDVQRACAALDAGGSRLLGTILNGTQRTGRESAYYDQYLAYDEA